MTDRIRLLPLDEEPAENRDKWKITPLFTGGLGGPQMVLMTLPAEEEEQDRSEERRVGKSVN